MTIRHNLPLYGLYDKLFNKRGEDPYIRVNIKTHTYGLPTTTQDDINDLVNSISRHCNHVDFVDIKFDTVVHATKDGKFELTECSDIEAVLEYLEDRGDIELQEPLLGFHYRNSNDNVGIFSNSYDIRDVYQRAFEYDAFMLANVEAYSAQQIKIITALRNLRVELGRTNEDY